MFHNFLSQAACTRLREIAASGQFASGAQTVSGDLRSVKQNQEFSGQRQEVDRIFQEAVSNCREMQDFIMPQKVKPPILSRYTPGMTDGGHLDTPLLFASNTTVRSDLSMTAFINEPDSYDGGELTMETDFGLHQTKLAAGDAVVYDTQNYHWVTEVTRGERLALVTWFQSLVADPAERAILFELRSAFHDIAPKQPDAQSTRQLQQVLNLLTRRWVRSP